jgi:parallel beta-helix repeat protein
VRADAATGVAEKLRVANNTGSYGVAVGNGSIIRDCVATANGTGLYAPDRTQVSNCISTVNTSAGIFCTSYVNVIDCTVSRNGGVGIQLAGGNNNVTRCSVTRNDLGGITETGGGSTVAECNVGFNPMNGIAVSAGSTVRGCTVRANTQKGITATDRCHLIGNTCEGNQTGIEVTGIDNRVDGNLSAAISSGTVGFHIGGSANVVVRNTAHGPLHFIAPGVFIVDTAYVFDNFNNNSFGPILPSAGGEISSSSPWANFQNF